MKSINKYITEKLKINKSKLNKRTEHTLFPTSRVELKEMINNEINKNGHDCDLNNIDVSGVTNMSFLFYRTIFNGDISD
jgi:hypothetical protein